MFRARYPEFDGTDDGLITEFLGMAAIEISNKTWGAYGLDGQPATKADKGQLALAAHELACSPFGQSAKTTYNNKTGLRRTTYGLEFERMMRQVTSGFRVA